MDLTGRREVTAILVVVTLAVELRGPEGKLNSRPYLPFGGGVEGGLSGGEKI